MADLAANTLVANLLAGANVVLALLVAFYQGRVICQCRRSGVGGCWLRGLHVAMALYWAGLYTFVLFEQPGAVDPVFFGQVFVRPAFTLTLGIMAAAAIQRSKQR